MVIAVFLVLSLAGFNTAHADKYAATIDVFKKAQAAQPFFENCYGYAVFPTIGKGGIGIGGAYGTGQVYAQGKPTGTAKMFKGTIGEAVKGKVTFDNENILRRFKPSRAGDQVRLIFSENVTETEIRDAFAAAKVSVAPTAGAVARRGRQAQQQVAEQHRQRR